MQTRVYSGYAKAAQRVGLPFDLYRPVSPSNPLATSNKITTIPAAFAVHTSNNFNFEKPSDYKGPLFHALLDGAQVRVGDYFKNTTVGTFFIIGMDPIVPILAVQASRTVTVYKPDGATTKGIGLSGYGGTIGSGANANELAVMTAWPASVLEGARGVGAGLLPNDVGVGVWRILLPYWAGVVIGAGYIVVDDLGKRMVVRQAELTDLGWNIQTVQALV